MPAQELRIVVATPSLERGGNASTARRWCEILREAGHDARATTRSIDRPYDLLVVLHSHKRHDAVLEHLRRLGNSARAPQVAVPKLVVAVSGTDRGTLREGRARESLDAADLIVGLEPNVRAELPASLRKRFRLVRQSARAPRQRVRVRDDVYEVVVVANLRRVKDPLRCALAVRSLPTDSRIRVVHIGRALDERLEERAVLESQHNARYEWIGSRAHDDCLRRIARARVAVLSSRAEGGANLVSEAIVCRTPILATRIPGNLGLLGRKYAGYFAVGATTELRELLLRCERDSRFYRRLEHGLDVLAPAFERQRELTTWCELIEELGLNR